MKLRTLFTPLPIFPVLVFAPHFSQAAQTADRAIPAWVWLLVLGAMLLGWWVLERRRLWKTEAAAEALSPVSPLYRLDDLKVLHGIGPQEEQILHEHAVKTYAQLAVSDPVFLHSAFAAAGIDHVDPETWILQARMATAHDWPGLAAYQRSLQPTSHPHP